ncbi:MAG: YdiU family protein, partial [Pseudomonadota bacterium]
ALIAWNDSLAEDLGLADWRESALPVLSGNEVPRWSTPVALGYAGHQFGHFVPALGDGRAVLLGERIDASGRRMDLQLKGSGRTPFSRGGDGRAPLGPVLREYLVSEAMFALGVPTTRSLAAVTTGDRVVRETVESGAVLTRVADSHLRIGTFEFLAARGDRDGLAQLTHYALRRHAADDANREPHVALALFDHVADKQASLIARWMALGFVHGVMNTDNMAISGQTIDYGPCAFLDEFQRDKVFSSIDAHGRYAFSQQPVIGAWNLSRLAGCLMLLHDDRGAFEARLDAFLQTVQRASLAAMVERFGLSPEETDGNELVSDWYDALEADALDYTRSWHDLADAVAADPDRTTGRPADSAAMGDFLQKWGDQLRGGDSIAAAQRIRAKAPVIIPRNHQIARAISDAQNGDFAHFHALREALQSPFDPLHYGTDLAEPPAPAQRVTRTFCGT